MRRWLDAGYHDTRLGFRSLRRSPSFLFAVILSLGLGIGANVALFSLLDALTLRMLPVPNPDRLLSITTIDDSGRVAYVPGAIREEIAREGLFDGLCAFLTPLVTVEMEGEVRPLSAQAFSGDCFETLGIVPAVGRLFGPSDDRVGAPNVVVLTYETWRRDYGGRLDAIGQTMRVEGGLFTIIGVTAPRFRGLLVGFPAKILLPLGPQTFLPPGLRQARYAASVLGRVSPGESEASIAAKLTARWPEWLSRTVSSASSVQQREAYLAQRVHVTRAATGVDFSLRARFERPLTVLLAISFLLLLVACANVGGLMLARWLARSHEVAVATALGAGPSIVIRQVIGECVLLIAPGIGLALVLAFAGSRVLVTLYQAGNPNFELDVHPDWLVFTLACAVGVVAVLGSAVAPVWRMTRIDPSNILTPGTRLTKRTGTTWRLLIGVQVSMILALVAAATMFAGTLNELRNSGAGVDSDGLVTARLLARPGGNGESLLPVPYYSALLDGVRALPGIRAAALSNLSPVASTRPTVRVGRAGTVTDEPANLVYISDGFLATMGVPMVVGSEFHRGSRAELSQPEAVVSRSLALKLFREPGIVGRFIRLTSGGQRNSLRIVGVTADAVLGDPREQQTSVIYLNYWGWARERAHLPQPILLARGDDTAIAETVRAYVLRAGREYVPRIETLRSARDAVLLREQLLAVLSIAFAALGLTLGGFGVLALAGFETRRGTPEIGIRAALGATRLAAVLPTLRSLTLALGLGVLAGMPLVWAVGRATSSLLYNVAPFGIETLSVAFLTVCVMGLLGALVPAWRATHIPLTRALRDD